jgi:hypothetical protein
MYCLLHPMMRPIRARLIGLPYTLSSADFFATTDRLSGSDANENCQLTPDAPGVSV